MTLAHMPVIPKENLFGTLVDYDPGNPLPTVAQCAAHLELLEAFLVLKRKVIRSKKLDTIFGLDPKGQSATEFAKLRLVKWDQFITMAVIRFEAWWQFMPAIRNQEGKVDSVIADTIPPIGRFTGTICTPMYPQLT